MFWTKKNYNDRQSAYMKAKYDQTLSESFPTKVQVDSQMHPQKLHMLFYFFWQWLISSILAVAISVPFTTKDRRKYTCRLANTGSVKNPSFDTSPRTWKYSNGRFDTKAIKSDMFLLFILLVFLHCRVLCITQRSNGTRNANANTKWGAISLNPYSNECGYGGPKGPKFPCVPKRPVAGRPNGILPFGHLILRPINKI